MLAPLSAGEYQIVNVATGFAFDVTNRSLSSGAVIQAYTAEDEAAQLWTLSTSPYCPDGCSPSSGSPYISVGSEPDPSGGATVTITGANFDPNVTSGYYLLLSNVPSADAIDYIGEPVTTNSSGDLTASITGIEPELSMSLEDAESTFVMVTIQDAYGGVKAVGMINYVPFVATGD